MKLILILAAVLGLSLAAPEYKPKAQTRTIKSVQSSANESLLQFILELISVVDLDQLLEDFDKHYDTDAALADVIFYLQTDDWYNLVDQVMALDGAEELEDYFTERGVPVQELLELLSGALKTADPGVDPDEVASLRPFLDDIETDLNIDSIISFLNNKLQSSITAQNLYLEISSVNIHDFVEQVRVIDEVQRLAQSLRDTGVKVDEALAIAYDFLGWGSP